MSSDVVWFALLGLMLSGYFALEGVDFGVGMILPLLGRTEQRRHLVVNSMGRVFLGNEVWLVAVIGLLAGAFPALDEGLLTGMYPLFVIILVAWITRDAGV